MTEPEGVNLHEAMIDRATLERALLAERRKGYEAGLEEAAACADQFGTAVADLIAGSIRALKDKHP